jgi:hypothetical protein
MLNWDSAGGTALVAGHRLHVAPQAFPIDDMLTERVTAHLIDTNRVAELDFGPVIKKFAQTWALKARKRVEVITFNPRTRRGITMAARHAGIQTIKSMAARLLARTV